VSRAFVPPAILWIVAVSVIATACAGPVATPSSGAETSTPLTRDRHQEYFPIGDGSKHASTQCSDCHQDATSFASFTCQSCHAHAPDVAVTRHEYITGFQNNVSNACMNCHPTGWEAPILPADHSLKYFPIQSGSHNDLLCTSCHADRTTSKVFACVGCHDEATSAGQHGSVSGYTWTDAGCYGCHSKDQ
jgi:hypothetical protein